MRMRTTSGKENKERILCNESKKCRFFKNLRFPLISRGIVRHASLLEKVFVRSAYIYFMTPGKPSLHLSVYIYIYICVCVCVCMCVCFYTFSFTIFSLIFFYPFSFSSSILFLLFHPSFLPSFLPSSLLSMSLLYYF